MQGGEECQRLGLTSVGVPQTGAALNHSMVSKTLPYNNPKSIEMFKKSLAKYTQSHCEQYLSNMLSVLDPGRSLREQKGYTLPCRNIQELVAIMDFENSALGRASFVYCFVLEFALMPRKSIRSDKLSVCSEISRKFSEDCGLSEDFSIEQKSDVKEDGSFKVIHETVQSLCKLSIYAWRKSIRRVVFSRAGLLRPSVSIPYGSGGKIVAGRRGSKSQFYYQREGSDDDSESVLVDYMLHPTWKMEWRTLCNEMLVNWSIHGFSGVDSLVPPAGGSSTTTPIQPACRSVLPTPPANFDTLFAPKSKTPGHRKVVQTPGLTPFLPQQRKCVLRNPAVAFYLSRSVVQEQEQVSSADRQQEPATTTTMLSSCYNNNEKDRDHSFSFLGRNTIEGTGTLSNLSSQSSSADDDEDKTIVNATTTATTGGTSPITNAGTRQHSGGSPSMVSPDAVSRRENRPTSVAAEMANVHGPETTYPQGQPGPTSTLSNISSQSSSADDDEDIGEAEKWQ
eukprot:scaffold11937_cov71-Cylindrotheca_fusiformis.AAC.1